MDEIKKLKAHYEDLASYWNGKDASFTYHGLFYNEDDVGVALEIVRKCDQLMKLIGEIENI